MRFILPVLAVALLAACDPDVPDSARGVGFDDYDTYLAERQAREAELRRGAVQNQTVRPPVGQPEAAPGIAAANSQSESQQTANAAIAAIGGTPATPAAAAPAPSQDNALISDEQDFQAVSNRQTIESDAQRRQAQSQQYQVIAPQALPNRPKGTAPTPIEFALSTTHPVGQKVYRRSGLGAAKAQRQCAKYRSGELAQDAFLKNGGPNRDKLGIDPDGDGYACGFNPQQYRGLARN